MLVPFKRKPKKSKKIDMTAVDWANRVLILNNGEVIPITNTFDLDNNDTLIPKDTAKIVAGPMRDGRWFATTYDDNDVNYTANFNLEVSNDLPKPEVT